MKTLIKYLLVTLVAFGFTSCSESDSLTQKNGSSDNGEVFMVLKNLGPDKTRGGSVNQKYENLCHTVTVLVFDSASGDKVAQKELSNQNGQTVAFSLPTRGVYDYYILANTASAGEEFVEALNAVKNVQNFDQVREVEIELSKYNNFYDPFRMDGFLMYASYHNVEVPENRGLTAEDPWAFEVHLTKAMAKVSMIFKQNNVLPDFSTRKVKAITINNIPDHYTAPSNASYYLFYDDFSSLKRKKSLLDTELKYDRLNIGRVDFYIPEILFMCNPKAPVNVEMTIGNNDYVFDIESSPEVMKSFLSLKGLDPRYNEKDRNYDLSTIFRNMSYIYNINIKQDLTIELTVTPWDNVDMVIYYNKQIIYTKNIIEDFEDVDIDGDVNLDDENKGNGTISGGVDIPDFGGIDIDGDVDLKDIDDENKGNGTVSGGVDIPDFGGVDIDGDVDLKDKGDGEDKGNGTVSGGVDIPGFGGVDIDGDVDLKDKGDSEDKGNGTTSGNITVLGFNGTVIEGDVTMKSANTLNKTGVSAKKTKTVVTTKK